jgi:hypothetical protein
MLTLSDKTAPPLDELRREMLSIVISTYRKDVRSWLMWLASIWCFLYVIKYKKCLISDPVVNINYKFILHIHIMFHCVDKPMICNISYEWSLLSIHWLYMFRTITSPSSGASSSKLYNVLVCSCYQASVAVVWMYIQASSLAVVWMYIQASSLAVVWMYINVTATLMMDWCKFEICRAN